MSTSPAGDSSAPGRALTLVVNPTAAKGLAGRIAPRVARSLVASRPGLSVDLHLASSFEDARRRATEVVQRARPADASGFSPDRLVVMGGDGMAHLGLNLCADSDVPLGIVPAGTGNDFCRSVGLPTRTDKAAKALGTSVPRRIDLLRVRLEDPDEVPRYVGCTVSSGYDAMVSQAVREAKYKFGQLTYLAVALRELAGFKPVQYRLQIDGQPRDVSAMFITVSNGAYFGGGMMIAPDADVRDGQLDITIAHEMGRGTLLRVLPKVYTGSFLGHPDVEVLRARSVRILGPELTAEGDGEVLGSTPLRADLCPGVLPIMLPGGGPEPRALPGTPQH